MPPNPGARADVLQRRAAATDATSDAPDAFAALMMRLPSAAAHAPAPDARALPTSLPDTGSGSDAKSVIPLLPRMQRPAPIATAFKTLEPIRASERSLPQIPTHRAPLSEAAPPTHGPLEALAQPGSVILARFDQNGLLIGSNSATPTTVRADVPQPHEIVRSPDETLASPTLASDEQSPGTVRAAPVRFDIAVPAIMSDPDRLRVPTVSVADYPAGSVMAVDTSPARAHDAISTCEPEQAAAPRYPAKAIVATTFDPVMVAVHEVIGGSRIVARVGELDADDRRNLDAEIGALLAQHGISASSIVILSHPARGRPTP